MGSGVAPSQKSPGESFILLFFNYVNSLKLPDLIDVSPNLFDGGHDKN